jgi:hypothetical protein
MFGGGDCVMADNQFWRDASDRLTFEMFRVSAADYPAACRTVATALSLTPEPATLLVGLDLVSMHFRRGECLIELAWDIWTGFTVTAATPEAEQLVREAVTWLLQSPWGEKMSVTESGAQADSRPPHRDHVS